MEIVNEQMFYRESNGQLPRVVVDSGQDGCRNAR